MKLFYPGKRFYVLFVVIGFFLISACNSNKKSDASGSDIEGWQLIWSDEFDVDGVPDSSKWDYRIWDPGRVNEELQAYTDRPDNSWVKDGKLTISAKYRAGEEHPYTSARLVTDSLFDFTYGKVEVRAKLPGGRG